MKNIIDNLTRQHRELTRVTMSVVPLLDATSLASDAGGVRVLLRSLGGILSVHVSMEDRSFYPYLLTHRREELRRTAERFLVERDQLQEQYTAYSRRWLEGRTIESAAPTFVAETRDILLRLGTRMMQEDRQFHPSIMEQWERET